MLNRAVIAFEEVLDHYLPISVTRPLLAETELQAVHIEATPCDNLRQVAQHLRKWWCGRIGVDEDPRASGGYLNVQEWIVFVAEALLLLGAWCGPQPTIQLVRPRVVGALQSRTVCGAVHDFMTPV